VLITTEDGSHEVLNHNRRFILAKPFIKPFSGVKQPTVGGELEKSYPAPVQTSTFIPKSVLVPTEKF
jgi:hypothetical protein